MTVNNTTTTAGPYTPNGVAATFPFSFKAVTASDVEVVLVSSSGAETVLSPLLYAVTLNAPGVSFGNGGSVVFITPPASTSSKLYVRLNPSFSQLVNFENQGSFKAENHTLALDAAALRDLFLRDRLGRSFLVPPGETGNTLPIASVRANKLATFDNLGKLTASSFTYSDITNSAAAAAASAATARYWAQLATSITLGQLSNIPIGKAVNVMAKGAIPNDPTAGAANLIAFNAAFAEAIGTAEPVVAVFAPAGVYEVDAFNAAVTGIQISPLPAQRVIFYGEGRTTVIRRAPTATLVGTAAIVWSHATERASVTVRDMVLDGNEKSCPITETITASDGVQTAFPYTGPTTGNVFGFHIDPDGNRTELSGAVITGTPGAYVWTYPIAPPVGSVQLTAMFQYEQSGNIKHRVTTNSVVSLVADGVATVFTSNSFNSLIGIRRYNETNSGNPEQIYVKDQDYKLTGSPGNWTITLLGSPPAAGKYVRILADPLPDEFILHNVEMRGCVGDGYHNNVRHKRLFITDCTGTGRTRRARADFQIGRLDEVCVMHNIVCDAIESEPAYTKPDGLWVMSDILTRGALDLAGDTNGDDGQTGYGGNHMRVLMSNVRQLGTDGIGLPYSNFFRVKGIATNCEFANVSRAQRCKIDFVGCTFNGRRDWHNPTVNIGVQVWHDWDIWNIPGYSDKLRGYVRWNNCTFRPAPGTTTGNHIEMSTVAFNETDNQVFTEIVNCRTVGTVLPMFFTGSRCGRVVIEGGILRASVRMIDAANAFVGPSSTLAEFVVRNASQWEAPAIFAPTTAFGGDTRFGLHGDLNGEKIKPFDASVALTDAAIKWDVTMVMTVDTTPVGRIKSVPGLRAQLNDPKTGGGATAWIGASAGGKRYGDTAAWAATLTL